MKNSYYRNERHRLKLSQTKKKMMFNILFFFFRILIDLFLHVIFISQSRIYAMHLYIIRALG